MKVKFISNTFDEYKLGTATLYFSGYATLNNKRQMPLDIIWGIQTVGEAFLKELNGFYSFVYISDDKSIACVDIIRSIPLFYTYNETNNLIIISDQANNLVAGHDIDQINQDIFQLCSYVVGNETLYEGLFQILAGEFLILHEGHIENKSFFRFDATEPRSFDVEKFKLEVNRVLKASFIRMLAYADGKQFVIPLSGGYDSRLIVSTLKELEYENVICFSYGVKGNIEAEYSKKIAESLGYKWVFIEYTSEKWKQAWASQEAKDFIDFASNHTSLPHVQDWLAVKELKESQLIEKNAIFVPGHCCVTSYITKDIINKFSKDRVLDEICKRHFILAPISESKKIKNFDNLKEIVGRKIESKFDISQQVASNVTIFNWQERQSKYIANSVRVYDFFDFSWWLPLWDKDFTEVWKVLPNNLRVNRKIFKEIVADKYSIASNVTLDIGNAKEPSKRYKLARIILSFAPKKLVDLAKNTYRFRKDYVNHYLCLDALIRIKDLEVLSKRGYKIIGIYAYYYIHKLWK